MLFQLRQYDWLQPCKEICHYFKREKNQMTVALLGLGIAYSLNFCCFSSPLLEEMSHE
jgi:hypothetical protein